MLEKSPSDSQREQSVRELREMALSESRRALVSPFSDNELFQALAANGGCSSKTLAAVQQSMEALKKLQVAEKDFDREAVLRRFLCGHQFVRGTDKEGRPIVWLKTVRNVRGMKPEQFSEINLAYFWVRCWAMTQRKQGSRGLTFVFDDHGREPLDFNLEQARSWCEISNALTSLVDPVDRIYVVGLSQAVRMMMKMALSFLPKKRKECLKIISRRSRIFDIVSNPEDVPDYIVPGRGTPFRPCYDTLGPFERVLAGNAYSALTLKTLYFPSVQDEPFCSKLRQSYQMVPAIAPACLSSSEIATTSPRGAAVHHKGLDSVIEEECDLGFAS